MLSAVISSVHSYPAMLLAKQQVHQRYVHSGPLVLGAAPVKSPTPTADRDQTVSRRFKPSSRTSLNGEQPYPWDRLQPQDEMSRQHFRHDVRPCQAYLRTPPLHFGRRPPQSNCPPCTVPDPDNGPRLEPQINQGGISRLAPPELASWFQSLPPILHRPIQSPMQSYSKGSWGLSV